MKALATYPIRKRRNKVFILVVFIIHLAIFMITIVYSLTSLKLHENNILSQTINLLFGIYVSSIALTAIHIITLGKFNLN